MKTITKMIIAFLAVLTLATVPASADDPTYKIRSSVYDSSDSLTDEGDFYWDANSFTGFWYQIKPGISSEVLYLHNDNASSAFQLGDKIAEGDLYYVSKPQKKKTKIAGCDDAGKYIVDDADLEFYYLMGFFGPQYIVMPEDTCDLSKGCKPDKIAKILLETKSDFKKQMYTAEEWELAGGWSLVAEQIDVKGNKVWVQLKKDGVEIDSKVISGDMNLTAPERTYVYTDSEDYPIFYCYVDSIFMGSNTEFVVFKYVFLRDEVSTIESGDTYGIFDVEGFEVPALMDGTDYAGSGKGTVLNTGDNALVLSSNKDISLNADKKIDLHAGMYLSTADTRAPCLKMTLGAERTIKVKNKPEEQKSSSDDEIIVVDMAEAKEDTTSASIADKTTGDETTAQKEVESDEENIIESSVAAPGFELMLAFVGLICAMWFRK
ncbi:MAG: S-layer protein domain-containing protein [Methanolobus sp.]|nr:S-layer protein domain-containing protein [Methanolobus sp.]